MKKRIRSLAILLSAALLLGCVGCRTNSADTGSAAQTTPTKTEEVQNIVDSMSLEEKVAQLFLVQPLLTLARRQQRVMRQSRR